MTANTDLLTDLADAREHCDEMGVLACVDRIIALRSTPSEAQQNLEDWLTAAYVPRDEINAFVAHLREVPPYLLLAYLATADHATREIPQTSTRPVQGFTQGRVAQ